MQGSLRECADEVNEEELRERERSGCGALAAGRLRGGRPSAQSGIASARASSSAASAVTSPRRASATWKTSRSCTLKASGSATRGARHRVSGKFRFVNAGTAKARANGRRCCCACPASPRCPPTAPSRRRRSERRPSTFAPPAPPE